MAFKMLDQAHKLHQVSLIIGLVQFILLIQIIAYGGIRGIRRREVWSYHHATS
jgi:hypothetical protein